MLHHMFTVYDAKTEAYLVPFFQKSKGEAIRTFTDTCKDENSLFNKHPEDFKLFYLGQFDDGSAEFEMIQSPMALISALEALGDL